MKSLVKATLIKQYIAQLLLLLTVISALFLACQPIRSFQNLGQVKSASEIKVDYPNPVKGLKNVILIADNKSTEMFDLLAPIYLFKRTGKANVFIVSKEPQPIPLFRGLKVMPHHTFHSFKSLNITPDLIIIPNLSSIDKNEMDEEIISFINSQYKQDSTLVLSVCSGAATAAQTGIFDGHNITSHSSDIKKLSNQWGSPRWINNVRVANSNNLYSTAGVANASEGSLFVIKNIFGTETAERLAREINFPKNISDLKRNYQPLNFSDKLNIFSKVIFRDDKKLTFFLHKNISEFELAALMDTYSRTFPESIHSFSLDGKPVISKNGINLIPSTQNMDFDEVHVINIGNEISIPEFNGRIKNHITQHQYIFDYSLFQIEEEFGLNFKSTVSKILDYED